MSKFKKILSEKTKLRENGLGKLKYRSFTIYYLRKMR